MVRVNAVLQHARKNYPGDELQLPAKACCSLERMRLWSWESCSLTGYRWRLFQPSVTGSGDRVQ
jgi:hypothetical protein